MSIQQNRIYQQMKVREGVYVPDVGIDYPVDDPYARLVPSVKVHDYVFDETYPYLDDSFKFKIGRFLMRVAFFGPVLWLHRIKYGMKINGRGILRKYRKELADGAVTVSNHCYLFDAACVAQAVGHMLWIPMLSDHINGKTSWVLRHLGGIPLPDEKSMGGYRKFNAAFDTLHERKQWIHVFPEARSWHFYKPVKPFRKGAFTMAYKYGVPVIPVNISYRERKGIFRLFGNSQTPLLTVNIGEPIFPNKENPRKVEVDRLLNETFSAICDLAGIEQNPWPSTWNEN